jgi:hypothetical protein
MYAEGGGKLPAYGEDFFQRIVGVHWREPVDKDKDKFGLAVEFFDGED